MNHGQPSGTVCFQRGKERNVHGEVVELVSFSEKKALRRAGNVFVEQMSTMQDSPPHLLQQTPKAKPRRGMRGIIQSRLFKSQFRITLISRKLNYLYFNILSPI